MHFMLQAIWLEKPGELYLSALLILKKRGKKKGVDLDMRRTLQPV